MRIDITKDQMNSYIDGLRLHAEMYKVMVKTELRNFDTQKFKDDPIEEQTIGLALAYSGDMSAGWEEDYQRGLFVIQLTAAYNLGLIQESDVDKIVEKFDDLHKYPYSTESYDKWEASVIDCIKEVFKYYLQ